MRAVSRIAVVTCLLVASLAAAPPASASRGAPANPAVVAEWNEIAYTTLVGDPTKAFIESSLYLGFVHAAVYNAVVGVEGRYEPYRFHARAPHRTSE
jgi:hypothetical protein